MVRGWKPNPRFDSTKNRIADKPIKEETSMKIRIKDNHIRFRIQENELDLLLQGEVLQSTLIFPNQDLTFELSISDQTKTLAQIKNHFCKIAIDNTCRQIWSSHPEKTLITYSDLSNPNSLKIEVALDLAKD
jgi:hypothetical protein